MNVQNSVWFPILMGAMASASFSNIDGTANIHPSAFLGDFINIMWDVDIKANVNVANFANIAASCLIDENSRIGGYSSIGDHSSVGKGVTISQYVSIGQNNAIGDESIFFDYTSTGSDVIVGKQVKVYSYANIGSNAEINDFAILDQYSVIGRNVKLSTKVYVGQYCVIHSSNIGESAVIHQYVVVPSDTVIKPNQVVIKTPSSAEFYRNSNSQIPPEYNNITSAESDGISEPFNNMLGQLIDTEIASLTNYCDEENQSKNLIDLRQIIRLYLIQYHGINNYQQYQRLFNGNNRFGNQNVLVINGIRMDCTPDAAIRNQLESEFHFGPKAGKKILNDDVEKKFRNLLAYAQDEQRKNRDDTFCSMFQQIQAQQREVICLTPNLPQSRC